MKSVTILYRNNTNLNAIAFIKANLEEIFGQYAEFSNIFISELNPGDKLQADAFLALDDNVFQHANDYVDDIAKVIKINRSPDRSALNQISKIPTGKTVLIVNDSYESSLSTTQSFYEVGIGHINMVAYDESLEHTGLYDQIDIAITPAESHLVPSHITNIIDIGYRKVSFETMFKLMKLLDLDISTINRNLFRHIHSIVESNSAFHSSYVFGYLKSEMLSHIVNTSKIGMVLVDSYYEPVYVNDKACRIFQNDDKTSIRIEDYIDPAILTSPDASTTPIQILGGRYFFDKYTLRLMDEVAGYYITLQDELDVELASKSMRQKGFMAKHQFKDIIHASAGMDKVIQTAKQIAQTDHTVLIRGESGTGKELIAQSIHNASYRNKYPFVAVNCAALPDNLLESELFGYEPGAFTGAQSKGKVGLFEEANHGTIFLDEIGDISPKLQTRLLRTIQERQVMKVGSERVIDIDIRLITATNKNLEAAVREGEFRSDLFFRLNVLPIVLPPLRNRKDDIIVLLQHFLGNDFKNITNEEKNILLRYDWPGNIRELENISTYYKTLSALPEYVLQQSAPDNVYAKKANIRPTVLEIIGQNTEISHGIGRNALLQQLEKRNLRISDGNLRTLLSKLEEDGLITISKGRYGTRITEKGVAALANPDKSTTEDDMPL
ncbi:sigma-54 interaction domain-containing protein [Ihubacter sp. mB4P-1]|uniref:sigma-54 interaction domain-containing protein n=1 Tax=Ihubacter sp. mB4P-1 TaxID=3242370 RepID=UPI00137AC2C1